MSNQKNTKTFYSISEVAKQFDVNPSLIRFWEKEFDILNPRKNRHTGKRMYTLEDIHQLRKIYHLVKEKGYTLEGANKRIRQDKKDIDNKLLIISKLKKVRDFLIDLNNHI